MDFLETYVEFAYVPLGNDLIPDDVLLDIDLRCVDAPIQNDAIHFDVLLHFDVTNVYVVIDFGN